MLTSLTVRLRKDKLVADFLLDIVLLCFPVSLLLPRLLLIMVEESGPLSTGLSSLLTGLSSAMTPTRLRLLKSSRTLFFDGFRSILLRLCFPLMSSIINSLTVLSFLRLGPRTRCEAGLSGGRDLTKPVIQRSVHVYSDTVT